jgi:hypothetical protein
MSVHLNIVLVGMIAVSSASAIIRLAQSGGMPVAEAVPRDLFVGWSGGTVPGAESV